MVRLFNLFLLIAIVVANCVPGYCQETDTDFNAREILRRLNEPHSMDDLKSMEPIELWWSNHIKHPFSELEGLPADLNTVLYLALRNSNRINIARRDPSIRETAITEADSAFDWVSYANSSFADISEPIGNTLTAGTGINRFEDQTGQFQAGLRKTTRSGGVLDLSQRFGWQNNNSLFLTPQDQATSRLVLSFTQPLLRGSGEYYNNSLIVLSQLDAAAAHSNFMAVLQDELVEITNSYWDVYLQRAILAQQMRLYLRTERTLETITARRNVDMQPTQLASARSALATRRADLIRGRTAITNAETNLRGLVNAPELSNSDVAELYPIDRPLTELLPVTNSQAIALALQNRPEIEAANYQIQAGQRQLGVAQNELQPTLNLISQVYGPGLRGNYNYGGAFTDQFANRPSYSVGLQYEFPLGNRFAKARVCRRELELARLQSQYAQAINIVQTEVDIAVREVNTTYREIIAKRQALTSAEAEVKTLTQRWTRAIDGPGTSSLNLEALLRSQERVTAAETELATSIVQYNLALVNLKRSNGTLLQSENVSVQRQCFGDGCSELFVTKGMQDIVSQQGTEVFPTGIPEPITFSLEELHGPTGDGKTGSLKDIKPYSTVDKEAVEKIAEDTLIELN